MANFERHGAWEINRDAIESVIADRFWQGFQNQVNAGVLSEFSARRKHQEILKSDEFREGVDMAIQQYVELLDLLDHVAVRSAP